MFQKKIVMSFVFIIALAVSLSWGHQNPQGLVLWNKLGSDIEVLNSIWVKIPGLAVLVSAFILFIWAQLALGNSWRLGIDRRHPGKLVTREIYSLSRHPIYLFFDLYFFAVFLLNANLVFLLFNIIIASVLHLQIMAEEKFMSDYYGAPYKEYASRVGMYFSLSRVTGLQDIGQSDTPE